MKKIAGDVERTHKLSCYLEELPNAKKGTKDRARKLSNQQISKDLRPTTTFPTFEELQPLPMNTLHQYCQLLHIYYTKNSTMATLIPKILSSLSNKFEEFPSLQSPSLPPLPASTISTSTEGKQDNDELLSRHQQLLKNLQIFHTFIFLLDDAEKLQSCLKRGEIYSLCKAFSCGSISNKRKEELTILFIERIIYDILPSYSKFSRMEQYLQRYHPHHMNEGEKGGGEDDRSQFYLQLGTLFLTDTSILTGTGDILIKPTELARPFSSPSGRISQESKKEGPIIDNESFDDNENVLSSLTLYLTPSNLSSQKTTISNYRDGKDLYTDLPINDIQSKEIDHIIERQFLSFGILTSCSSPRERLVATTSQFYDPFKQLVNDFSNLNITEASINSSKGQTWKEFLKEEKETSYPRDLITIMMSETNQRTERIVAKYLHNVILTSKQTFPHLIEELQQLQPINNVISSQKMYPQIVDRLMELWQKTGFEDYEKGVMTRRMKKYTKIK